MNRTILIGIGAAIVLVVLISMLVSSLVSSEPRLDAHTACREAGGYCDTDCESGYTPSLGGEPDISCTGPETGGSICCLPSN